MNTLDFEELLTALKRARHANPTDDLCSENAIIRRHEKHLEIFIENKQLTSFFEQLGVLFTDDQKKLERMLIIQFIKSLLPYLVFSFRSQLTVAPSRPSRILTPEVKRIILTELDLAS